MGGEGGDNAENKSKTDLLYSTVDFQNVLGRCSAGSEPHGVWLFQPEPRNRMPAHQKWKEQVSRYH